MAMASAMALLAVDGLVSDYGRVRALDGVALAVGKGELVALVGANGAGKTTLLRCLSGVQPTRAGSVRFAGTDITQAASEARVRAGIGHVPEGRQVFAPLSVEDNLRLGAFARGRARTAEGLERAYALFPILAERRAAPAGALSGGQQQMLAVGRALMSRPTLLLMDEPSMGLAPLMVREIFSVVRRLRDEGTTILLVEQNARAALAIADRGYVLETGRVILSDTGPALLADDRVRRAYLGR